MNKIVITCLLLLSFSAITAQNIEPSLIVSGADYNSVTNKGAVLWTLGGLIDVNFENDDNVLVHAFWSVDYGYSMEIEKIISDFNMKVYPNPSKDYVNISIDQETLSKYSNLSVVIVDMYGRTIFNKQFDKNLMQIDLTSLSSSAYIINIIDNNRLVQTAKILKIE